MSVTINVFANDNIETFQDFHGITQAVDDNGTEQPGSVTIIEGFDDQLIYTPPVGFTGNVTFTYKVKGHGHEFHSELTDITTVSVTVTESLPPVDAVNDMDVTEVGQRVIINVLFNDSQDANVIDSFTDAFDDSGNVQLDSVESNFIIGDSNLRYTPPFGFEGSVAFHRMFPT